MRELFERVLSSMFPVDYRCMIETPEDVAAFLQYEVSVYPDTDPYYPLVIHSSAGKANLKHHWPGSER